ncbi:hypothetical protein [Arthrobacter sp. A2-55]|uniref:hypothetical protein n=1 Tax=Arthrobacter sp. A2-55 TaxID=2897337 RepID=UPI0021CD868D|nr:hypothetical protein [Arthrobacter sp. A2-55]MCU6481287.1 hypothetical protein [Arthrobacter sp. A2-55]
MSQPETVWVTRWVVALSEPLIGAAARAEIDSRMVNLVTTHPHWFAAWASGYLSSLVCSLDSSDPWTQLSIIDGKVVLPDGSPFGTWVDATDLIHADKPDLRSDLGLAALFDPLSDESARMLATASRGWDKTLAWCESEILLTARFTPEAGVRFFEIASAAIRWAIFRRRIFAGKDDPYIPVCATQWLDRALKVISGERWDEARAARMLAGSKVQDGTYAKFTGSGDSNF